MKSASERYIEGKLAVGMVSFLMTDIKKSTGLSEITTRNQLQRLSDSVIQAFFLIVTLEHRAFGTHPVKLWLDDYFTGLAAHTTWHYSKQPSSMDQVSRRSRKHM